MIKRFLMLGLAAVALALVAPAIGAESGLGGNVAQAQTDPTAPDQTDTPEAPDQADPPEAPDQTDPTEAPDSGDDTSDDSGDDNTGDESQCAGASRAGAHASGEDCPTAAPAPAQPSPQSQPQKKKHHKKESGGGGGSGTAGKSTSSVTPQVTRPVANVTAGVDTGTIPQGGIQAGAGGTADDGSVSALLPGGALMLVLAASGLALRRRHGLES